MGWVKSFWLSSPELREEMKQATFTAENEGYWCVMFKVPKKREIEFIHEIEKHIEIKMNETDLIPT